MLKLSGISGILGLLLALAAFPQASSASDQANDIELLDDYSIIIGDLGDKSDGWSASDTRVLVGVDDGRSYREHYFDSLPAMMFVLREKYNHARITSLAVPEYAGTTGGSAGPGDASMLDGRYAWYVWDYDRYGRGGTPLVLAFDDYDDARKEASWRNADLLRYEDAMWRLYDWAGQAHDQVYWRGWDADRWSDPGRWNSAWDRRWPQSSWDSRNGWIGVELRLGDFTVRWESDVDVFRRDRYYDNRYYRDRVVRDFVFDVLDGGRVRWVRGDHDRGHGNDPDRFDEDNPGKSKRKGPKNNPGKGKGKHS